MIEWSCVVLCPIVATWVAWIPPIEPTLPLYVFGRLIGKYAPGILPRGQEFDILLAGGIEGFGVATGNSGEKLDVGKGRFFAQEFGLLEVDPEEMTITSVKGSRHISHAAGEAVGEDGCRTVFRQSNSGQFIPFPARPKAKMECQIELVPAN